MLALFSCYFIFYHDYSSEEVLLSLVDCGGQPIFFDVLPVFLNRSTVFVLVLDVSQNLYEPVSVPVNSEGQQKDCGVLDVSAMSLLQKWMAFVHARMGGFDPRGYMAMPPICLVGTHADHLAPLQGRENTARKFFDNIISIYNGKGV